ncbi:hypothetical protein COV93_07780 [Candidatus Woesearchaeota archaeon CG11_big_fil_rev_8_21_14_0_20_43_8]|nr:MAG: hypothetical protein COV93_07780 [Candidatus Woesearchaeota archaeon CG11_big_fil_rev_8_21_14_0_20_43_8]PIO06107.1 MAG: hypothetical protein COT47_03520 [Candidatus Woesearchaeota archaeon CG08_land_8_20_14_0_20_43_7]
MVYDIFAGGPSQHRAREPYIDMLRDAFPDKEIFSPFDRPTQEDGAWKYDNLQGIMGSRAMLNCVPSFPFPGVMFEAGFFYNANCERPGENLVQLVSVIDPKDLEGPSGKSVLSAYGQMVTDMDSAIERLNAYFDSLR